MLRGDGSTATAKREVADSKGDYQGRLPRAKADGDFAFCIRHLRAQLAVALLSGGLAFGQRR